jgi:cytochrome c oxidase cbb3-type subunit 1
VHQFALATVSWGIIGMAVGILIAVARVAYAIMFLHHHKTRAKTHLHGQLIFSAFFITVAISHIVSNLAVPVTLTKSFPIYAGTVDAMVQRW